MQNQNRPWTPEEDERLRSMLEGGDSVWLVAAKLKRTTKAVKTRKAAAHIRMVKMREPNSVIEQNLKAR
jgi:hypothetical protein